MDGDLTPNESTPAPEASDDVQVEASEESASPPEAESAQINAQMNAMIRGELAQVVTASKPGGETDDDDTEGSDEESAAVAASKPSDTPGKGVSRRQAPAEIARLRAENDRLQKALDEVNPPPPDASEEARKARLESESRFRRLLLKPDTDQDWDADDWTWLQGEKAKRAVAPELQQHYETVLEADRAALYGDVQARERAFLTAQAAQITALAALPGVDGDALKAEASYERQGRMLYEAGRASMEAEVTKLRDELAEAKRELYGRLPKTLNGGRSAPGRTVDANGYMNQIIRNGGGAPRR